MAKPPLRRCIRSLFVVLLVSSSAPAQSGVTAWGNAYGMTEVPAPPPGRTFVQIAGGASHAVALLDDGSVLAWGESYLGQCDVPPLPEGLRYLQVDAGVGHTLALRSDGWIVAFGLNGSGECFVPPLTPGLTYVEVSAGGYHSLARRSDGFVVGWGSNVLGESDAPPIPSGLECVEIAAAGYEFFFPAHSLARLSDGSILAWGESPPAPRPPPGVRYVDIDAGSDGGGTYSIALRSDGEVVVWGTCQWVCDVPALPPGTRYTGIAAGEGHALALRSDGSVVAWGIDGPHLDVPRPPEGTRYVELGAGNSFSLGRVAGCATCELPFCLGDGGPRSEACPCTNVGARDRGCDNSASTGGAKLTVRGSVDPDRVVLEAVGMIRSTASLFVQGTAVSEVASVYGDGLHCIGGALRRIATKNAVAGTSTYPGPSEPSVSARSAALGDPIAPGSYRYYQVVYRDADPSFCGASTWNSSNAVMVAW